MIAYFALLRFLKKGWEGTWEGVSALYVLLVHTYLCSYDGVLGGS